MKPTIIGTDSHDGRMALILDSEFVEKEFEIVLRSEAGVGQEAFDPGPVAEAVVVEHFQIIGDDERHMAVAQTFAKHQQSSDTTVAVLKRMYSLKALVKIQNVVKRRVFFCIIFLQEGFDLSVDIFGTHRIIPAHFIGEFLIVAYPEPVFALVGSA